MAIELAVSLQRCLRQGVGFAKAAAADATAAATVTTAAAKVKRRRRRRQHADSSYSCDTLRHDNTVIH